LPAKELAAVYATGCLLLKCKGHNGREGVGEGVKRGGILPHPLSIRPIVLRTASSSCRWLFRHQSVSVEKPIDEKKTLKLKLK